MSSPDGPVVVLAGGTGGAKLARGMLDVVGAEDLVVIANTGDDIEIYGSHVSPDPDLVSFWLADEIDERGWGLRDDTFAVMDGLRALGRDVWFNLGDRDLAWCLERKRMIDEGLRPTEALARLNEAIGVRAKVLPMCDQPLHTWIRTDAGWRDFQQFMIRDRAEGAVREVAFARPSQTQFQPEGFARPAQTQSQPEGFAKPAQTQPQPESFAKSAQTQPQSEGFAGSAQTQLRSEGIPPGMSPTHALTDPGPPSTPEALAALAGARAVIVGPSNPVISIWPIVHVLGEALAGTSAPVVCISPVVGGEILKGPTAAFLEAYEKPVSAAGVVGFYERIAPGLLDGIVADETLAGLPTLQTDTAMVDAAARMRVAAQTLTFAETLAG